MTFRTAVIMSRAAFATVSAGPSGRYDRAAVDANKNTPLMPGEIKAFATVVRRD